MVGRQQVRSEAQESAADLLVDFVRSAPRQFGVIPVEIGQAVRPRAQSG